MDFQAWLEKWVQGEIDMKTLRSRYIAMLGRREEERKAALLKAPRSSPA
ncbi:hypothetical protein [Rhizobium sp. BK176]|nr:hypothetical protein [Rhizobium sp. BK176]MCS4096699.1 phosphoserine phosphatase [Rhizobium sp. BK176]